MIAFENAVTHLATENWKPNTYNGIAYYSVEQNHTIVSLYQRHT